MSKKLSSGGFAERNERSAQQIADPTPEPPDDQELLDALMESGFVWEEAVHLLGLRERLYENSEIRQRMNDDCRIQFVRWLYENGEISEI